MARETEDGRVVCEQCGNEYQRISQHWSMSSECSHPPLTEVQRDILVGSLLGDGCIENKRERNQRAQISWASEEQCEWIGEALGWLAAGVSLQRTAEEQCERAQGRDDMVSGSDDPDDWSAMYVVRTRTHPFITRQTNRFYGDSGHEKKCWPEDLVLSPTVLLIWYVSDGTYSDKGGDRYISISTRSEIGNKEKVEQYFKIAGIPEPCRWGETQAIWNVKESNALFDYMAQSPLMSDGPPDGFEAKFPIEYGGTGRSMVDVEPAESSLSHQTPLTAD